MPIGLTATDEGMVWGHSQVLGLGLCWEQGHLRFYDPVAGEYLPNLAEVKAQLDAAVVARADAEARADVEAQRANAEAQRADAAEAELRRLRERLRGEAPE